MTKANQVHPVVKIEAKTLRSLRSDTISAFLTKYKIKFMRDQNPKEKIPSFVQILNQTNYSLLKPPNQSWQLKYDYLNSQGVATIISHNPYNTDKPSLVFHHGLFTANNLHVAVFLNGDLKDKFNIFSIRAANHKNPKQVIKNCINTMTNLASTMCASTQAVDEVVDFHRNNSSKPIAVVGVSFGGMITALHYFLFNSAEFYFPAISYPNFGKILLSDKLKHLVYNPEELKKNISFINCLEIPPKIKNKDRDHVFPILAREDEYIDFSDARDFWRGYQNTIFDTGHYSIALKVKQIRQLINNKVILKDSS